MTHHATQSREPFDPAVVTRPPARTLSRVGIPVGILAIAAALLLAVSWRQLVPATAVDVVPVVLRPAPASESGAAVASGATPAAPAAQRSHGAHGGGSSAGTIQAAGWIEPSPLPIYVAALEAGVVSEVLVLEGAEVKSGQPLVRLIDEEARLAVDEMDGALEVARARVIEAEDTLQRKTRLRGSDAVSENELIRLQSQLERLQGEYGMADAKRRRAELALQRMTVRAPTDGIVMRVLTSPGSVVGGMEHSPHVAHLYDPKKLQVRADIPNADMGKVEVGLPVEITVDAAPDKVFHGILKRFVNQADTAKNTVEAKIEIADPDPVLRPDMLVRCRVIPMNVFHGSSGAGGAAGGVGAGGGDWVFAPESLLAGTGDSRTALVLREEEDGIGVANSVTVTVGGTRPDGWVHIVSGLAPGDALVDFRPHGTIADGSRVRITRRAEPAGGARGAAADAGAPGTAPATAPTAPHNGKATTNGTH